MRRIIYLLYYIKDLDRKKWHLFSQIASEQTGRSAWMLKINSVLASLRYNISLLDYFLFRFYTIPHQERVKWAGTGFMYQFQLRMNPPKHRRVLADKLIFLTKFSPLIRHPFLSLNELETVRKLPEWKSGKWVLKDSLGQCGWGIEVIDAHSVQLNALIAYMKEKGFNMIEPYIQQHPDIEQLSPSGLNTVRVITQVDDAGNVHFLGARLRITVNNTVDNMASGNIAAPVDIKTGVVYDKAVYSHIGKDDVGFHPITGVPIVGFQLPFWDATLELVEKAALWYPHNRSVGWDIAITDQGPDLLEGNHNWCKLLWQLPVKQGLKHMLLV